MSKKPTSGASPTAVKLSVDASKHGAPLALERYALGQGGLSDGPMMEPHVEALRWLKPRVIRLFVQEYYDVYPAHGKFHWDSLDRAVKSITDTGAKPLMSICIKPRTLYPEIDQDKVHPSDYDEWESVIEAMVRRYNGELGCGIEYWEVFNEPDIGETGACASKTSSRSMMGTLSRTNSTCRRMQSPSSRSSAFENAVAVLRLRSCLRRSRRKASHQAWR